jgi:hypothetical protein
MSHIEPADARGPEDTQRDRQDRERGRESKAGKTLYNQARCFEQNGQYAPAAGRYREFLRLLRQLSPAALAETGLTLDKVASIEAHATKLEQSTADPQGSPADVRAAAAAQNPLPAKLEPSQSSVRQSPAGLEATPTSAGAGWRRTGIALLTAGAVGLAGSTVAGLLARRAEQDLTRANRDGGTFDDAEYRNGKRAAQMATIGFIAAPAAVLLGGLVYWKGVTAGRVGTGARLQVVPTLARAGLGVLLAVSY